MAANVSRRVAPRPTTDPRFQPGAYITDGEALYHVRRPTFAPGPPHASLLVVEDCATYAVLELDYGLIDRLCTLVRPAPGEAATHPDPSPAV